MRKLFALTIFVMLSASQLMAQSRTLTGKVTDAKDGTPLASASVLSQDGKYGTKTDANGAFTISIPASVKALVISTVGFTNQTLNIGSSSSYSILLKREDVALTEVVVTSLGITKEKRAINYSTQTLKSAEIADRGEVNVVNALQGKIAGVSITGASGSAGASTNINIRGITSFTGNNQPLFVIDGVPISNDVDRTNGGPLGTLGDNQPANRAMDIDINNIETINVMKGPAASVLYGSRAASGAIIITTKKGGKAGGGAQVILNSAYSAQTVTGLPELQNKYGQGVNGTFNPISTSSWGPAFGSTPSVANGLLIGGVAQAYNPYPNNIRDFYQTGTILDNSLTINGGDAKQNYTFSLSNLNQTGILPNTGVNRTSVKFGANTVLRDKIRLGGSMTVTNTLQDGILGGNGNSSLGILSGIARNIDLTSYRVNGTYKNPDGSNNWLIPNQDNPYFDAYEDPLKSNLYRFIGNINVGYDITSWLTVAYRLGADIYTDRRKQIFAVTSARVPGGQVVENTISRSEINGDLTLTAKKDHFLFDKLNFSALLGQNLNQRLFQNVYLQGDNLAFPGFYNISNATVLTNGSGEATTKQRLIGYYAQASFNYDNYLFVELTGRADRSSTLPEINNTYFYPSVTTGFVFTDAFKIKSNILSYGKLRASYAKVGRDAGPYLLANTYASWGFGNNVANFNFPLGTTAGFGVSSRIAPVTLSPEFTSSIEFGVNLGFFKNKVTIDAAYYDADSKDQIINVAIPSSTGYSTKTTNVGEMTNKGVELSLNVAVIKNRNFSWDVSGNYTKNVNKVVSIAPGVDNFGIPGSAFIGSIPSIKVGYPYGVIIGGVIPKSPVNGQRLINPATGVFQPSVAGQVLSDPNADYKIGLTNNFKYKNYSLGFTFDFTKGGQILSFTAATYKSRGIWAPTAEDRDKPRILPGEILDATGKYIPNNIQIPAQTYWQTLGGLQSEFNVYDATVLRMRELSFGYDISQELVRKLKIGGLRFSIFARNLFYVAPNAFFDPEVNTQGAGNIRGLELQSAPNARTIGANLKLTF